MVSAYPLGFSGDWVGMVAAGSTQLVTVVFAPTAVGSYGGELVVSSDALSGSNSLAISGRGVGPFARGLVLDLPLSGDFHDVSGNGCDGTPDGIVQLGVDRLANPNSAAEFGAGGGGVEVTKSPFVGKPLALTVSLWANPTQWDKTGNPTLIEMADANVRFLIYGQGSDLAFLVTTGGQDREARVPLSSISVGEWHHFAMVADGTNLAAFVDGQPVARAEAQGPFSGGTSSPVLTIGRNQRLGAYAFSGSIDEVRVYDVSLNYADICVIAGADCNPLRLLSATKDNDGLTVRVRGLKGQTVVFESSTDLITWVPAGTHLMDAQEEDVVFKPVQGVNTLFIKAKR